MLCIIKTEKQFSLEEVRGSWWWRGGGFLLYFCLGRGREGVGSSIRLETRQETATPLAERKGGREF